jgi:hypothetical protein
LNTSIKQLCLCFLVLVAVVCGGCGDPATGVSGHNHSVTVEQVPPPEILAEAGKPKLAPAGFMKLRLQRGYPSIHDIIINDKQYVFITEKWFLQIVEWVENYIALQIPEIRSNKRYPVGYVSTVASMVSSAANITVAKRYDLQASVLIGVMRAKSVKPWGDIPADGKDRSYLVTLLGDDPIVYDVWTKQLIPFARFPNLETMDAIAF